MLLDTTPLFANPNGKKHPPFQLVNSPFHSKLGLIKTKYVKFSNLRLNSHLLVSICSGEHEYIDVITEDGERLIIDVDFRSEFEIARSTSGYKSILQCLPSIFVGKSDRLLQIISIASEAARQSLKKKGMHIAPWRKAEYVKSKWLGPHSRIAAAVVQNPDEARPKPEVIQVSESERGELDLIFGEETSSPSHSPEKPNSPVMFSGEIEPSVTWQLPELRPKSLERGNKVVVTGLAALLKEKL